MINKKNLLIITSLLLLASCAGKDKTIRSGHIPPPQAPSPQPHLSLPQENLSFLRQVVVEHALKSLGAAYLWGGTSPATGFDCSGLVLYTHSMAGVRIPRTTTDQFKSGKRIAKIDLKPADLVFFKNPQSSKGLHVGIYIGDNLFIHAPGRGRQVTYADLSNIYFQRNYLQSRQYID